MDNKFNQDYWICDIQSEITMGGGSKPKPPPPPPPKPEVREDDAKKKADQQKERLARKKGRSSLYGPAGAVGALLEDSPLSSKLGSTSKTKVN